MQNTSDLLEIGVAASEAAVVAGNPSFTATAANAVGGGIQSAADWVRQNPTGGLLATAAVGLGVGYLAYKAFSKED